MARIRSIKPEFWIDEKVVDLSAFARLLFIGMWNFADDQGFVDYKPRRMKMQIFPGDDIDIQALINELLTAGRVIAHVSPVGPVLQIVNWHHQRVDKPARERFGVDELRPFIDETPTPPHPPVLVKSTVESPRETSATPRESSGASLATEGMGSGSGVDGMGSGGDLPPSAGTALALVPPAESVTQRSKRITDAYAAVEPMSKWPAVNGIVIKAIKSQRWADNEIRDALLRLGNEGRPVTVDTLRIELNGLPPARAAPRASTTDSRVDVALQLAAELERQEIAP